MTQVELPVGGVITKNTTASNEQVRSLVKNFTYRHATIISVLNNNDVGDFQYQVGYFR
jgi:hypothetical protein